MEHNVKEWGATIEIEGTASASFSFESGRCPE
jgi:hypothetical protein